MSGFASISTIQINMGSKHKPFRIITLCISFLNSRNRCSDVGIYSLYQWNSLENLYDGWFVGLVLHSYLLGGVGCLGQFVEHVFKTWNLNSLAVEIEVRFFIAWTRFMVSK